MNIERNPTQIIESSMNGVAKLLSEARESVNPKNKRGRKILQSLVNRYRYGEPTNTTLRYAKNKANGDTTVV